MSPITTEAKLEEELALLRESLKDIEIHIEHLRSKIRTLKSKKVGIRIAFDEKAEELRRFQLMYPDICKPPVR